MQIAVDIPELFPPGWKIASGALEYETRTNHEANSKDVTIVLPNASMARAEDRDPERWDGIIARRPRPELNVPQVFVSSDFIENRVSVTISHGEVVKLAIDQFTSMGLKSLAFFGNADWGACPHRWGCFSKQVESLGIEPVFISSKPADEPERALLKVQKPCGIMTFNDMLGFRLLDICKKVGLDVPRDFHVISVDDTPACMESSPTLSSISMPFALVGYHAARLCAQMIKGESVESIQLPPSGLIIRDSIRVANDDFRSAAAVAHYLRENISYPIQMEDVVRRSSMSRRRLEEIFRAAYGDSPIAYLRKLRVEHAKKMLESSDAPLKDIVDACGWSNSIQLCRTFKKMVGLSPMLYRKSSREGEGSSSREG